MDHESLRAYCLSLPRATERVQWGNDLLFCIGDKMFTVLALDPSHGVSLSLKCTPETFAELTEREGIIPAPYVARYHWVALEQLGVLKDAELKSLIKRSYELVRDKLPKRVRDKLESPPSKGPKKSDKASARQKPR